MNRLVLLETLICHQHHRWVLHTKVHTVLCLRREEGKTLSLYVGFHTSDIFSCCQHSIFHWCTYKFSWTLECKCDTNPEWSMALLLEPLVLKQRQAINTHHWPISTAKFPIANSPITFDLWTQRPTITQLTEVEYSEPAALLGRHRVNILS